MNMNMILRTSKPHRLIMGLVIAALFQFPALLQAADKSYDELVGTIIAVDIAGSTFTLESKRDGRVKYYVATSADIVLRDGSKGALANVRVSDHATIVTGGDNVIYSMRVNGR